MSHVNVGIYSSAASRFVVEVITNGSTGGTPDLVGVLRLLPGVDSSRVMLFEFTDSAGKGYDFMITLSDVAFETFDVFGGKKSAGDKSDRGAY